MGTTIPWQLLTQHLNFIMLEVPNDCKIMLIKKSLISFLYDFVLISESNETSKEVIKNYIIKI